MAAIATPATITVAYGWTTSRNGNASMAARRKEEASRAKERERRQAAIVKAQAAIEEAKRDHDKRASTIEPSAPQSKNGRRRRTRVGRSRKRS
jgi:hypothetical protein